MGSKKQAKSEQTYKSFMEKLKEYVVEGNVDQFTIRGLCSSIGYSPRTFYLYFENKEQAILKCFEYFSKIVCSEMQKQKGNYANAYDWLMFLLIQHQQIALNEPSMAKQVYISTLKYYDSFSVSNEYPLFQMIRDALISCERECGYQLKANAEQSAWALIGYSRGIQIDYFRRNEGFDLIEVSRSLLKTYLESVIFVQK